MRTLKQHFTKTLEVKQSKFIAHFMPYDLFETTLKDLKTTHPKARHFVTAFRYLNTYEQIVEGSSDDGEPKGTSGKPTLSVLQGHDIINAAVIVVRYFGGTKLGTGGLVRAYSDATNFVLDTAQTLPYEKLEPLSFSVKYSDLGFVEYVLEQKKITQIQKRFDAASVYVEIYAAAEALVVFQDEVKRRIIVSR